MNSRLNRVQTGLRCVLAGLMAAAFITHFHFARAQSTSRPNVILVITDDQGYGDVGAHGNTMIQTPQLDKLHAQSVRLTQFHVDPTCSPTRSALMTGRYSTRTGVWHTILGRSILYKDEVTMADVFKAGGYRTGIFGKWHLGDNYPSRPMDRGFDVSVVHGGGGVTQTPDYWDNDYFDDTYFRNGDPEKFDGYCTDVFFREASKFIQSDSDQPFFCYLTTNAPHGPFNVSQAYKQPYLDKGVPEPMASFYGMITNIDDNMGRLTAMLEETGLDQNTILIFMTDNGTAAGVTGNPKEESNAWAGFNDGMRGQKGSAYEGGHRVPFFIRWPKGNLGQPRDVSNLSAHIDILPTLADLCEIDLPTDRHLDGTSLASLIKGAEVNWPNRTLFVHSQRIEYPRKWKTCSVMTEEWRLIDGKELYRIEDDRGQTKDLSAQFPGVVENLRHQYEQWWTTLEPRFDDYPYISIGNDAENPAKITAHDWHGPAVPWNQRMVRNMPHHNGYWMVDVEQTGWYRFTLRHWPEGTGKIIEAKQARLKIADVDNTIVLTDQKDRVMFNVYLPKGKTKMQTWLTDKDSDKSRGAFFIDAERLK